MSMFLIGFVAGWLFGLVGAVVTLLLLGESKSRHPSSNVMPLRSTQKSRMN